MLKISVTRAIHAVIGHTSQDRRAKWLHILSSFDSGLITEAEAHAALDKIYIHGGFDKSGNYTGYDYESQEWISS